MSEVGIVAVGASAGGPETLKRLFGSIDDLKPAILLAQHNLAGQMEDFARWLSTVSRKEVKLVLKDEKISGGVVYVPGPGKDLVLKSEKTVGVEDSKGVVAPNIDTLFHSVARVLGKKAVVIVLGGLGSDGVLGAVEVVRRGGKVIVQKDAKFPFLPMNVLKSVRKVSEKTLDEIAVFLQFFAR